jgi:hypothetical protein
MISATRVLCSYEAHSRPSRRFSDISASLVRQGIRFQREACSTMSLPRTTSARSLRYGLLSLFSAHPDLFSVDRLRDRILVACWLDLCSLLCLFLRLSGLRTPSVVSPGVQKLPKESQSSHSFPSVNLCQFTSGFKYESQADFCLSEWLTACEVLIHAQTMSVVGMMIHTMLNIEK